MRKILIYLTLLVFGVGCQPVALTQPAPLPTTHTGFTVPASPTQEPKKDDTQMTQTPQSSGLASLVEKAKEDLAQRLFIDVTQISLLETREVVWPDASLGCPQPGMRYKQVPEDGALIVLEAQGTIYNYHNGGSRGLFLCEKVVSNPEKPPQIDITNLTPQINDKNNPPPLTPDQGIPPGEDQ